MEDGIVLDGVFQDEHGDFPAGTYVRNPPTTAHTPRSDQGCTIFVKLWQFDLDDRTQFRKDMAAELGAPIDGVARAELLKDAREGVSYLSAEANAKVVETAPGGIELLVIAGSLQAGDDVLEVGSWLRLPDGAPLEAMAGPNGAQVWMKTGHLPFARAPQT